MVDKNWSWASEQASAKAQTVGGKTGSGGGL